MTDKRINKDDLTLVEKRIADLEREKLEIKKRIEALMNEMAKETRIDSLRERRYEVGTSPNDLPID